MQILQLIETKLNTFGIPFVNDVAEVTLAEVDQYIKTYCYIDCIPEDLLYVRANLTVDYIRYMESNNPAVDGQLDVNTKLGPLTSIKSGDVQYNFGSASSKAEIHNAHIPDLDSLVTNYTHLLNKFRRIKW